MSSVGTGYDLSAATFSPDGRIFQTEYALKAVDAAGTCIALRGKDGTVFAVEKLIKTKLYLPTTNRRLRNVDTHIGFAFTGMYPDAHALAEFCIEEAQDYFRQYRTKIPCQHLADRLSLYMHAYTLYGALRPFGCSVFLSSWSEIEGPQLFMIEPSGVMYGYRGWAIGKGRQAAKTEIEKLKLEELTVKELIKEAARIIYAVRDETKDRNLVLEMSWVSKDTKGKHEMLPPDLLAETEAWAKEKVSEVEGDEEH
ncbi:unnamed protein product [Soboliphyme baturini]|uniref:Proteasome subunit alpha type-3 n=1 Tax=Soboliphyme baturini TaxID=241478 RepID=A0A183IKE4_9BILA|nr:unnamed protein product [Soboliphyme baturini]